MKPRWVVFVFCTLVFGAIVGCKPRATRHPFNPGDPQATVARLQQHLRRHPEDDDAWRDLAHVQWLHQGKAGAARPVLDRLAQQGDPVARLSLLVMADARLDVETIQAQAFALIKQAGRDDDPMVDAAAAFAAREMSKVHGDLQGGDDRFVKLYGTLPLGELPYDVVQPLVSLRASIARRRGNDYRPFYAREGCVRQFEVSPLIGRFGDIELASKAAREPFKAEASAELVKLACVVRVWNPTRRAGIRRLRTFVEVPGKTLQLDLSSQEPMRVYLDGELIVRTDRTDRFPANRYRVAVGVAAGRHELEVATAVTGERAWIMVRAVDGRSKPVAVVDPGPVAGGVGKLRPRHGPWPKAVAPIQSEIYAPLRAFLALHSALIDGASDRAEGHTRRLAPFKRFAEGLLLAARFERADPSRGQTASSAREQTGLERALRVDPRLDAARLRYFELMLGRGEEGDVLDALAKLPKDGLQGLRGQLLRFRAHQAAQNEHKADAALRRAASINPDNCRVLMAQREISRERDDVRREDALAQELSDCGGSLKLRARLAERRGDREQAGKLWAEALRRVPDEVDAIEGLARIAASRGDRSEAQKQLARLLALNPQRVGAHVGLADLAAAAGQRGRARKQIAEALAKVPHAGALHDAAAALGTPDPLMRWRVDGSEALKSYRAAGGGSNYEGVAEVLVLDRSVARIYPNGGQRQIVHLVVHLLSKEALDRYGEMKIPGGARLLALHTFKPDGTKLEPELVQGKEGLSLRHLEIGDVVEYEFVVESQPSGPLGDYIDVSTFRFQSLDTPYHRSELLVVHPPEIDVRVDRRNDPPEDKIERLKATGSGALVVHHWRANEVPRLGVEPGHRALLDELPSVRVYTPLDVDAWLQNLAASTRYAQRANPELRRLARKLSRGKDGSREKLRAVWKWVVENVEDAGDISSPATATLAARAGNRLMLLKVLLREAGVSSQLWLARDAFGPRRIPGGHPMVESFDAAMLAVDVGDDRPMMVLTASKVMPLGYLTPGYAGTDGLRVPLDRRDGPAGKVKLPASPPELSDHRRYALSLELDAKGAGTVRGTIALQGMEAVAWRQALRDIDRDRIQEMFQQAELGWLRGATVSDLTIRNEKELRKPLVLDFTAAAEGIGVNQGGALVLRSSPMPLNPGARYTSLPQRMTGIIVPYAPIQEAKITFKLRGGAQFTDVPQAQRITSPFGSFEREVEGGGVGKKTLVLRYRSTLRAGVVEPGAYTKMADFTRRVEAAERALIRAK